MISTKPPEVKKIIDLLNDFNLSVTYDKIISIETAIANAIVKEKEESNGVYVPPNIVKGKGLHFAINNSDFKNDTPNGKKEFHGTG